MTLLCQNPQPRDINKSLLHEYRKQVSLTLPSSVYEALYLLDLISYCVERLNCYFKFNYSYHFTNTLFHIEFQYNATVDTSVSAPVRLVLTSVSPSKVNTTLYNLGNVSIANLSLFSTLYDKTRYLLSLSSSILSSSSSEYTSFIKEMLVTLRSLAEETPVDEITLDEIEEEAETASTDVLVALDEVREEIKEEAKDKKDNSALQEKRQFELESLLNGTKRAEEDYARKLQEYEEAKAKREQAIASAKTNTGMASIKAQEAADNVARARAAANDAERNAKAAEDAYRLSTQGGYDTNGTVTYRDKDGNLVTVESITRTNLGKTTNELTITKENKDGSTSTFHRATDLRSGEDISTVISSVAADGKTTTTTATSGILGGIRTDGTKVGKAGEVADFIQAKEAEEQEGIYNDSKEASGISDNAEQALNDAISESDAAEKELEEAKAEQAAAEATPEPEKPSDPNEGNSSAEEIADALDNWIKDSGYGDATKVPQDEWDEVIDIVTNNTEVSGETTETGRGK